MSDAIEKRQRNPLQHSFDIMEVLSRSKHAMSLSDVSSQVEIHKSTVLRLLTLLVEMGYLERTRTGQYALGAGLIALAGAALERNPLAKIAQPVLDEIAEITRETVTLSIWNMDHAVDIALSSGSEHITYAPTLGMRNPAHCTATGKALLASLPPDKLEQILDRPLRRYTPDTITDPDTLRARISEIQQSGIAWNYGEFAEQLSAVAIGVLGADGEFPLAAMAISVPDFRFDEQKKAACVEALRTGAHALSSRLARVI